jgi:hypothetical protein
MKDFSRPQFRLTNSSVEVKAIYTGFLIFALVGYLTVVIIQTTRIGFTPEAIAAHYRGGEDEDTFPIPFGQILEQTHFHAFTEGVILLTLGHLFLATGAARRFKQIVLWVAFGSTFFDLGVPWLIRYVAPEFAYLQMAAWIGILLSSAPLLFCPLKEMWLDKGKGAG